MNNINKTYNILKEAQKNPEIFKMVDILRELSENKKKRLNNTHVDVYMILCDNPSVTYEEIGETLGKSVDTIRFAAKDVYEILNQLIIKGHIGKRNFRTLALPAINDLKNSPTQSSQKGNRDNPPSIFSQGDLTVPDNDKLEIKVEKCWNSNRDISSYKNSEPRKIEVPHGPLPPNSKFYVEREGEKVAYKAIETPGEIIRIISKRKSGASSFVSRIRNYAKEFLDYHVIYINFKNINKRFLKSIESFMLWFCEYVSEELEVEECINKYWKRRMGAQQSSQRYFEKYLLLQLSKPIIIVFERVDCFFFSEYEEIARDFFALIRTWYESRYDVPQWQKIRYIIVQGEQKIETGNERSPFNVGIEVRLVNFSDEEIIDLARRHQLNWSENNKEIYQLTQIFGENIGNPYLIRQILYYIVENDLTFEEFIDIDFKTIEAFRTCLKEQK